MLVFHQSIFFTEWDREKGPHNSRWWFSFESMKPLFSTRFDSLVAQKQKKVACVCKCVCVCVCVCLLVQRLIRLSGARAHRRRDASLSSLDVGKWASTCCLSLPAACGSNFGREQSPCLWIRRILFHFFSFFFKWFYFFISLFFFWLAGWSGFF